MLLGWSQHDGRNWYLYKSEVIRNSASFFQGTCPAHCPSFPWRSGWRCRGNLSQTSQNSWKSQNLNTFYNWSCRGLKLKYNIERHTKIPSTEFHRFPVPPIKTIFHLFIFFSSLRTSKIQVRLPSKFGMENGN